MDRSALRGGVVAVLPLVPAMIPFGMVSGAAVAEAELGLSEALGLSVVLFAGAAQLAVLDVLDSGGAVLVAVAAAWVINLRFLLYSTSLAAEVADVSRTRRLGMGYVLTDQAFAVAVSGIDGRPRAATFPRYLGAAWTMWISWQIATVLGVFLGDRVPDDVPLEFAVPLLFLAMVIPVLTDRAPVAAAVVGGVGAVVAAELGAGDSSLLLGALAGIVAGTVVERSGR
ncbi:MAG: AzlC family ABC transporter permease [Actinomycetota bacterium]